MDIKVSEVIYKLYVKRIDSNSYYDEINRWFDSVIIPKVGDCISLDVDDWTLKGKEFKVEKIVYPLPNTEYKVDVYVSNPNKTTDVDDDY